MIESERKQFVTQGEDINPHLDSDSGMTPALTILFSYSSAENQNFQWMLY